MLDKFEAGKGDEPRPCNRSKYRKNFDSIDWSKSKVSKETLVNVKVKASGQRILRTFAHAK